MTSKQQIDLLKNNSKLLTIWIVLLLWIVGSFLYSVIYMVSYASNYSPTIVSKVAIGAGVVFIALLSAILAAAIFIGIYRLRGWARVLLGVLFLFSLVGLNVVNIITSAATFGLYFYLHQSFYKSVGAAPAAPATPLAPKNNRKKK